MEVVNFKKQIVELMLENGLEKDKGNILTIGDEYNRDIINPLLNRPSINLSERGKLALPTSTKASNYIFIKGKIMKTGALGITSIGKQKGEDFDTSIMEGSPIFEIGRIMEPMSINIKKTLLLPDNKLEKIVCVTSLEELREVLKSFKLVRIPNIVGSIVTIDSFSDEKVASIYKASRYKLSSCPIYIGSHISYIPQGKTYISPEEDLSLERSELLKEKLKTDDIHYFESHNGAKVMRIGHKHNK
jgi:hypothetical protein